MSLSITINNINDLSDTERAVLRIITGESAEFAPSVSAQLQHYVRSIGVPADEIGPGQFGEPDEMLKPVEPTEVFSPLTQVIDMPTAPAPAPAPAPVAPCGGHTAAQLDSAGLPWDKRIHSASRGKLQDGTWRYARNLDKAFIATVEAELRAVQAIPVPVGGGTTAAVTTPAGWPFATHGSPELDADAAKLEATAGAGAAGPTVADVTAPSAAPIVPLPPTVPPAPTALPMTFAQLMQHVTPLLVSGKLTQPILQQAVEKCGLPHLAALGARPDLVETVKAAIDEAVGGVQ